MAPAALAVSLTNGDFATGDFTGWPRDTDDGPGGSPDFSIVGPAGAYAAQLQADYWSDPGNTAWERIRRKADSSGRAWVSGTKYDSGENVSDGANAPSGILRERSSVTGCNSGVCGRDRARVGETPLLRQPP